jgi:hypothetical protein
MGTQRNGDQSNGNSPTQGGGQEQAPPRDTHLRPAGAGRRGEEDLRGAGRDRLADALAAFLAGLHGLTSDWGRGGAGSASPIATLLSNVLNADAGVAQLVSALAGLRDGSSAFDATPFATPRDPGSQAVIAAEVR